jgi:NAD(P)-dependent dehydrogenase (short-subunit alcohol dehydrogenase family)
MAVYLITGASSGIGAELSRQAVAAGHKVYGVARRRDVLEKLAGELGTSFIPVPADVTDRRAVKAACEGIEDLPDIAILNAGIDESDSRREFSAAAHERVFAVNYFGVVNFVDALLPGMMKRGSGKMVAISSLAAHRGLPTGGAYCASKAAVTTVFESCRVTYGWSGVKFVTVHPGFIETPMQKGNKRPLMWPVDRAARRILRGIERGCSDISFPLVTRLAMLLAVHLPIPIYDRIMGQKRPKSAG